MMKLDEAIRHEEEKAEEHEQLAEWLKELKRVREQPWLKELKALREQKRPHGDWEKYGDKIEAYDIEGHKTWGQKRKCTNCGFIKTYIEDFGIYPFCPNCSALMWKEEGEQK